MAHRQNVAHRCSGLSCRFVLREAVSQTEVLLAGSRKIWSLPKILGFLHDRHRKKANRQVTTNGNATDNGLKREDLDVF